MKILRLILLIITCSVWNISIAQFNCELIEQTPEYIVVKCSIKNYSIIQDSTVSIVVDDCLYNQEAGYPNIPSITISVLDDNILPPVVEIISSKTKTIFNKIFSISKGMRKGNDNIDTHYEKRELHSIYPQSLFSFGKAVSVAGKYCKPIAVSFAQYNAAILETTIYEELIVKIYTKDFKPLEKTGSSIENQLLKTCINYRQMRLKSTENNTSETTLSMLILCAEKYKQTIEPYRKWKIQKGIVNEIITIPSSMNAQEIKNYIAQFYTKYKNNIVLLVGNETDIPQYQSFDVSDNAYGYLWGNDAYPEVIVGRMPVDNETQLQFLIQKIIAYEQQTTVDSTISNYLMIASGDVPDINGTYDFETLRHIADTLKFNGFAGGDELYDGNRAGDDKPGNPDFTMLAESINNGKGLVLYAGHSLDNKLTTTGFSTNHCELLTNKNNHPIAAFAGCKTGQLSSDTCLAEAFLWANNTFFPTGFSTLMASTNDQWWDPPIKGLKTFSYGLIENIKNNTISYYGLLALQSFVEMNNSFQQKGFETTDAWSIYGDPTLQVFTEKGKPIQIIYSKKLNLGDSSIEIESSKTSIQACVSFNGKILAIQQINSTKSTLQFPIISDTGTVFITYIGNNCIPKIDSFKIEQSPYPFIKIKDITFSKPDSLFFILDTLHCSLSLLNLGLSDAENVTITMRKNPSITIKNESITIPKIQSGKTSSSTNAFTFNIHSNGKNNDTIMLAFDISTNNATVYTFYKPITIKAPNIIIDKILIIPTNGSNSNNKVEPGEIVTIHISIKNIGEMSTIIENADFNIQWNEANSIQNKQSTIILNPDSLCDFYYTVAISNINEFGQKLPCTFTCNVFDNPISLFDTIEIAHLHENWDNNSFSNYDWYHESSNKWQLTQNQAYSKPYSLESGTVGNSQSSAFSITIDILRDDSISFMSKTSCESAFFIADHYSYYDNLEFSIDQTPKFNQAGISDWIRTSIPVSKGIHTFTWTYKKDDQLTEGDDKAWVDDIVFPPFDYAHSSLSITSKPDTIIEVNKQYNYTIETDIPSSEINAVLLPIWLILKNNTIYGTPTKNDIGIHTILLSAKNGNIYTNQYYNLHVKNISNSTILDVTILYPNPAKDFLYVRSSVYTNYQIYNMYGNCVQKGVIDLNTIDIKRLPHAVYSIEVKNSSSHYRTLFTKIE